jgi:hypothetical protein
LHNRNFTRIFIACLLPGLLHGISVEAGGFGVSVSPTKKAYSNRPWGNFDNYKPGLNQQPGAVPNSQYPGAAPGTGWYPQQAVGTAGSSANETPVVEVETRDGAIYEQQNIVYTVRVVSSNNLKILTPVVPRIEGAILDQVDGPFASTRYSPRSSQLQFVNEYHFRLTPLRSGEIVVPPIRFTGTHVANRSVPGAAGKSFSISAASPLELQVLPAEPGVMPWLPLNDLRLRARMQNTKPGEAGVPVTLTVEMHARGALGTQLPSVEQQLKRGNFQVYRDSVDTRDSVSPDGSQLRGSRTEIYTIVPLEDGWIELPPLQVAWWDIDTGTSMMAGYAGHAEIDNVAINRPADATAEASGFSSAYFWMPLLVFAGLIAGYWLRAWAGTQPYLQKAGENTRAWLTKTGRSGMQYAAKIGKPLSPSFYMAKLSMAMAFFMPRSVKLWLCTRCLEREERPEEWCAGFRSRVCQQLDISEHAPITSIVEKIIEVQPSAEPVRLRELAHTMDRAVYGSRPLDFAAWKKDFRGQLRPRLHRRRRPLSRRTGRTLPALNPHSA